MGGFGSTRWGWRLTRATTDGLLAVDVRVLARGGLLSAGPGFVATGDVTWTCPGTDAGEVSVEYRGDEAGAAVLAYRTRLPGGDWRPVRERVGLDRTGCHFGGNRTWFRCPGCDSRVAMLFGVGGLFRCRHCHNLAFASTREAGRRREFRKAEWPRP